MRPPELICAFERLSVQFFKIESAVLPHQVEGLRSGVRRVVFRLLLKQQGR